MASDIQIDIVTALLQLQDDASWHFNCEKDLEEVRSPSSCDVECETRNEP